MFEPDEDWREKILSILKKGENSRQMCSVCQHTIHKDKNRISFGIRTKYGYSYKRICEDCIRLINEVLEEDG
jgi:hypothetical protein